MELNAPAGAQARQAAELEQPKPHHNWGITSTRFRVSVIFDLYEEG